MQCRVCHQQLSPAEALSNDEWERDFEDFERACNAWSAHTLEDVDIPDSVAPDVQGITILEDGTLVCPASWLLPMCDRCWVLDDIEKVFYGWDGSYAYNLMQRYAEGIMGCPKSTVTAFSWALVRQQWGPYDEEDSEYTEAVQLTTKLLSLLTAEECHAAIDLAEEVFTIAREHGAIWV